MAKNKIVKIPSDNVEAPGLLLGATIQSLIMTTGPGSDELELVLFKVKDNCVEHTKIKIIAEPAFGGMLRFEIQDNYYEAYEKT